MFPPHSLSILYVKKKIVTVVTNHHCNVNSVYLFNNQKELNSQNKIHTYILLHVGDARGGVGQKKKKERALESC